MNSLLGQVDSSVVFWCSNCGTVVYRDVESLGPAKYHDSPPMTPWWWNRKTHMEWFWYGVALLAGLLVGAVLYRVVR